MKNNLLNKLLNMRIALQKEQTKDFSELVALVARKAKYYKIIPLYCFLDDKATLRIVDLDDVNSSITFTAPAEVNIKSVKQYLYKMAFEVDCEYEYITPRQYLEMLERIKVLGVTEKEILERYHIKSLADMTTDIYKRCNSVLDQMAKK